MKRIDLFEFEDLAWFPAVIREGGTDYLRFFFDRTGFYDVTLPLIEEMCERTGTREVMDLCSGGGGGLLSLASLLRNTDNEIHFTLTDKFPNHKAFAYTSAKAQGQISFHPHPVDALAVPAALPGNLSMYSAAHHFSASQLATIITNAARQRRGVAIFDGGNKSWLTLIGLVLLHPVLFVLFTPFFKPFHWKRIAFTYLLPLIPLMTIWDGISSILRLHTARELADLARKAAPGYYWKAGYLKNKVGFRVAYLCGYPAT